MAREPKMYVLELDGYDGDDTAIETRAKDASGDCACGCESGFHDDDGACEGSTICYCSGYVQKAKEAPIFCIVSIGPNGAEVIDNGYRSREEAKAAWKEAI